MKERAREQRFWLVKFVAAFILSFPVFLLAMVFENIPATDRPLQTNADGFTAVALTKWALVTPVQVRMKFEASASRLKGACFCVACSSGGSMPDEPGSAGPGCQVVLTAGPNTLWLQFIIGWSFHKGAWRALRRGTANMDVLVSLGTSAAYAYSVASVIIHKVLRSAPVLCCF